MKRANYDQENIDRMVRSLTTRDDQFGRLHNTQDALFLKDFRFLTEVSQLSIESIHEGRKFKALRILCRRFGRIGALSIVQLWSKKSNSGERLLVRARKRTEYSDDGKALKQRKEVMRDHQDYQIAAVVLALRKRSLTLEQAIDEAFLSPKLQHLQLAAHGREALKKALTRFNNSAKIRGYADPFAPVSKWAFGMNEMDLLIDDIPTVGRPKKNLDQSKT